MPAHLPRYIAILDVGHGNCCVLKDDRGVVVIDTGLGTSLLEFLRENGIKHIGTVLLSHADQDHISGLTHLLASKEVSVDRVRLNSDAMKRTAVWRSLVYELEDLQSTGQVDCQVQLTADSGEDFSVGKVKIEVLAPGIALAALSPGNSTEDGKLISTNTVSCVLRLSQDGRPIVILPGDIDDVGLDDLIRRRTADPNAPSIDAPLLVYPHHGGLSGLGDPGEFASKICRTFRPDTVVFSIGRGKHDTPRPAIVEAIRRSFSGIRIACTQLSEHCAVDAPADNPSHLLPIFAKGKSERSCCAGTMLIDVDAGNQLAPSAVDHGAFVTKSASSALCQRHLP
jgi:beta-lactamase superfamily II metal-dependent hydrolase